MTWNGMDYLTISIRGSGEYVKKQCANLVNTFEDAAADHLEEIRGDMEELARDNYNDR